MNHRKLYEKFYGIKIGPEYHIHHINFNPKDNRIQNLILLPNDLHKKLHSCRKRNIIMEGTDDFRYLGGNLVCAMCAESLHEIATMYDALFEWVVRRESEYMAVIAGEPGKTCGCLNYNSFRKSCEK